MPSSVPGAAARPRRFGVRALAFGAAALIVVMAIPLVRGLDLGADGEKIELVSARSDQERSDGERFKIALLKVITSYGVAAVESLSVVHLDLAKTPVTEVNVRATEAMAQLATAKKAIIELHDLIAPLPDTRLARVSGAVTAHVPGWLDTPVALAACAGRNTTLSDMPPGCGPFGMAGIAPITKDVRDSTGVIDAALEKIATGIAGVKTATADPSATAKIIADATENAGMLMSEAAGTTMFAYGAYAAATGPAGLAGVSLAAGAQLTLSGARAVMGVVRAGTKTLVHMGVASQDTYKMTVQMHEGIPNLTVIAIAAKKVLSGYLASRSALAHESEVNAIFWGKSSVSGFVQGSGYNVGYEAHTENGLTRVRSISIKPAPGVDPDVLLGLTADSLLRLFRPGFYRVNGVEVWVQDPRLSTSGNDLRALQEVVDALKAQVLASLTFDGTYRTTVDVGTGVQRIPVSLVFEVKDRAVGGHGSGRAVVALPQFEGQRVNCTVTVAFRPVGTVDERGQMTGTLPGSAHLVCLEERQFAQPRIVLDSDAPQDCDASFEASLDPSATLGGHITDCKGQSSGFKLKKD